MADAPRDPAGTPDPAAAPARAPKADKPGQALKAARTERGLSLDEVVVQTKLPLSTLEAMEADDFATLSEPVYVRGYYRKYASVLGVDDTDIIAGYRAHSGAAERKPEVPLLVPDEPRGGGGFLPKLALVGLVALIVGVVIWLMSGDDDPAGANDAVGAPLAADPAPAQAAPSTSARTEQPVRSAPSTGGSLLAPPPRPASQTEQPRTASTASRPASSSSPGSVDAPDRAGTSRPAAVAATPPPAASSGGLVLVFDQDSWTRVDDANGERLLSGLIRGGRTERLGGEPPYQVFLGYGPGVTVRYAGREVAVAPHLRKNNTARFTVE